MTKRRHAIAVKLLLIILGFSSLMTLASTAWQLLFDYRRDVRAIDSRFQEVESTALDSIADSLWNVDVNRITLQLDGIRRLPDMQWAEVAETAQGTVRPILVHVGEAGTDAPSITREMALYHQDEGGRRQIGTLRVSASLVAVYDRMIDQTAVILAGQFVKSVIVSTFIFFLFHTLITRRIGWISAHLRAVDIHTAPVRLDLAPALGGKDEVDDLADAINSLSSELHASYARLSETNARLARASALADHRAVKLAQAVAELRRLAMIAAHHLQEPLRPMMINAQRIARDPANPEATAWSAGIRDGATHLGALLRDFQLYVAALTDEPRPEPDGLRQAARAAAAAALIRNGRATIALEALPEMAADRHQLEQVFAQLFDNAVQHGRPDTAPAITVSAERHQGEWIITIADNGPGFDPQATANLFEAFEVAANRKPDQTGLGLPLCKAILQAHGGRIWVEQPPQGGGLVRFALPA
jgi:signal transduction histidine kinase